MSSYFDDDRDKILNSSLSTIQTQIDVIDGLLRANKRLSEGLNAATREIKRLTEKAATNHNSAIM